MQHASSVEVHLDELAKSRGVVILERLGVAKGLQQRIRVEHLLLDRHICVLTLHGLGLAWFLVQEVFRGASETLSSPREVGQDDLSGLGLASARLSCDDDGLVVAVDHQVLVRILRYHEEMRLWARHTAARSLVLRESAVLLRHLRVKYGQPLEGVHRQ